MTFQRKTLASALRFVFGIGGAVTLLFGHPASAQQTKIEKLEVTGSNIKRVDTEGPAPVTILQREDIERSGVSSVQELMRAVTAGGFQGFDERNTNLSSGNGYSNIALRGLASSETLVLLNGRRIAPAATGGAYGDDVFVDLNSIPLSAIERIEILKDGASAIYGSDAIAGVVNIILRKDFRGAEISVYGGQTAPYGDGTEYKLSLAGGFGDLAKDRYNVFASFDYFKRQAIPTTARKFSSTAVKDDHGGTGIGEDGRSVNGNPGTWRPGVINPVTGAFTPSGSYRPMPGCPAASLFGSATNGFCLYDFLPWWQLIPEAERIGVYTSGNWDFSANMSLFATYLFNKSTSRRDIAPTPIANYLVPANAPGNTTGGDAQILYRVTAGGPRSNEFDTMVHNLVLGLKGSHFGFDWETGVTMSELKTEDRGSGYNNRTRIQDALNRGLLRPFQTSVGQGPGDAAGAAFIAQNTARDGTSRLWQVDVKASRELFQLPAGPVSVAFGAELRREKFSDTADSITASGVVDGNTVQGAKGERDVNAQFIEFSIPIVKGLETQLAVRRDDYDNFGSKTNPKVGLAWRPTKEWLVRGTYSKAFRAPTLIQQYQAQSESFNSGVSDPLRCPVTNDPQDCGRSQVRNFTGGNTGLKPQTADVFTVGAVWEPSNNLSLSVDYYNIEMEDVITVIALGTILSQPSVYGSQIVRDIPTPQDIARGIPGAILFVNRTYQNIANLKTDGVDFEGKLKFDVGGAGKFEVRHQLSWLNHFKQAFERNVPLFDYAGWYQYPRIRAWTDFIWGRGPWEATLSNRYVGRFKQQSGYAENLDPNVRSQSLWDLSFAYTGFKNTKLQVGVRNLADTDPPFDADGDATQGYNYAFGEPRGRFIWGKLTYSFK